MSIRPSIDKSPAPFCVKFCELVRDVDGQSSPAELGSGLIETAPYDGLKALMLEGIRHVFEVGAASRFGLSCEDELVEELGREISVVIHDDSLSAADILLTDGVSHGLSCLFEHCQKNGLSVLLPLPCYFGYELSALQSGVEIAGYYEPDGPCIHWLSCQRPVCLVVNTPDALTGGVLEMERLRELRAAVGPRLELSVFDLICAMHGYSTNGSLGALVPDLWRIASLGPTVLLFGVTKDLAMPGFRSGLMIGSAHQAIAECRASIFARAFSVSVVVGVVMLAYFKLLAALQADDANRAGSAGAPRPFAPSRVFPTLDEAVIAGFLVHRRQLDNQFRTTLEDLAKHFQSELRLPCGRGQHVGYSVMAKLRGGIRGLEKTIDASRAVLRLCGLRVNPSYMFGGNPDLWESIYPGQLHLRLNLSTPVKTLRGQVRSALAHFGV